MNAQEYIKRRLDELKPEKKNISKDELTDFVYKTIMSKKFRKFSANQDLMNHVRESIKINIQNNQPINFVFPHGAYKLWRLEEAPNPDWAELFTSMYFTKWLKPICEVYEPGVLFEYFVDDSILIPMNNLTNEEVESYLNEYEKVLHFLKKYQPENFKMTIVKFSDVYGDMNKFNSVLNESIEKLTGTNPTFAEEQLKMTELNARPTEEQKQDPKWREKIRIIHDAYMPIKREQGYYYKPEKIPVFCQNLSSGKFVAVGTTKTSIAKFWVGVGALQKRGNSFIETILSLSQIDKTSAVWEEVKIDGLNGKNFSKIRIIE